ncbi:MAG: hypothetical protein DCC71_05445 [Proteobacteria bacterium]|nr:MAG: hypothetical protein DCC71_05445 [Pseudomonadota bacterium]
MHRSAFAALATFASIAALLLAATGAVAQPFSFTMLVRTGAATPGIGVTFDQLGPPVIDHGNVAFCGQSFSSPVAGGFHFVDPAGAVTAIATEQTPSPLGGSFQDLCIEPKPPSIDGDEVAFVARSSGGLGVFRWDGATLDTIVDEDTVFPDTSADVRGFEAPSLDGRVAITWSNSPQSPNFAGVYSFGPLGLEAIADTNLPEDDGAPFFNVSFGTVSGPESGPGVILDNAAFAFWVNQSPSGPHFVYRRPVEAGVVGEIELIAGPNSEADGGAKLVDEPIFPQMDRSDRTQLCFRDGGAVPRVYRWNGEAIETVADTSAPIPDGDGTFTGFGIHCAIDDGDVVFVGYGADGQQGVYLAPSIGGLVEVVSTSDTLGGETPFIFQVSREAISDGEIAFEAAAGFTRAIWVTRAPEADAALAAIVALGALAGVRRRR